MPISLWGNEDSLWGSFSLSWEEASGVDVAEFSLVPNFRYWNWEEVNMNWEEVGAEGDFYYWNWEDINVNWESLNVNWEDLGGTFDYWNWEEIGVLIEDVIPIISGAPLFIGHKEISNNKWWYELKRLNELPEEKKRKIIKIAYKIEGVEFEEYKYKFDKNINITVDHIDIIVDKFLDKKSIKVKVENIY